METLDKPLGPTKPQTAHSLQTQSPYSNPDFVVREPKTPNSKLPEPKTPNPQTQIPKPKTPNPQTQNPKLSIVAKQPGQKGLIRLKVPGDHSSIRQDCSKSAGNSSLDVLHILQLISLILNGVGRPNLHRSVFKNGSYSMLRGLDLLHLLPGLELLVAAAPVAPGYYRTVPHCNKSMRPCSVERQPPRTPMRSSCTWTLHTLQLVPNSAAVTTIVRVSPSHHVAIAADGCKCPVSGLYMLHVEKLILHCSAVSTVQAMAVDRDRRISTDGCQSKVSALNTAFSYMQGQRVTVPAKPLDRLLSIYDATAVWQNKPGLSDSQCNLCPAFQ